jgi:hypothetical protein
MAAMGRQTFKAISSPFLLIGVAGVMQWVEVTLLMSHFVDQNHVGVFAYLNLVWILTLGC